MRGELAGKVIIITGAARGIGGAAARLAAASGAGALFLTDRDAAPLAATAESLGDARVAVLAADLEDPAAPAAIARAAITAFGRIDGLVNSAGYTYRMGLDDATLDGWDRMQAVNARAPFFLMQQAVADMRARGAAGSIVNIQSMHAHIGLPDLAVYAASKAALQVLTRNTANAFKTCGIRVNGLNLGWVLTESEMHMQADVLGRGPGWVDETAATLPLGRLITPEEVARQIVHLLSDDSAPMTGVSIDFDQNVFGGQ
ncbi:MAG: SDR family oxidoreductase [Rubellimicrobium sp.]|nr:SDR family oxidoreductase [Rubellimicrobium sp.]